MDGEHVRGSDLPLDHVSDLGERLGLIHRALAANAPPASVPAVPPSAEVASVAKALEAADRYLATVAALDSPSAFDRSVAEAMEQRKQLLGKYGDLYPKGDVPAGPYGWTHGDFQELH